MKSTSEHCLKFSQNIEFHLGRTRERQNHLSVESLTAELTASSGFLLCMLLVTEKLLK